MWSSRKTILLIVNFLISWEKKEDCKVTYLNWKGNTKEQTEEAL